ncbi:MAG: preprotein translocase subunit SecG [Verrucomicrobiota bacterium]
MGFIIGLLTIVMVLDCLLLILLVLVQLPKKDAGAGMAFGGGTTDALFGAGKGNVLTNITKWAAIAFFTLAVLLSVLQSRHYHRTTAEFERSLTNPSRVPAAMATPPEASQPAPAAESATAAATNKPAPAGTNTPSK